MLKRTQGSLQKKLKPWAYALLLVGAVLAATGQYFIGGQVGGIFVLIGIALIAISCVLAIIVYPWILGF